MLKTKTAVLFPGRFDTVGVDDVVMVEVVVDVDDVDVMIVVVDVVVVNKVRLDIGMDVFKLVRPVRDSLDEFSNVLLSRQLS